MTYFWIDETRHIKKTYDELLIDLNSKRAVREYIYFENPYEVFLELAHSLAVGKSVVVLDFDFSHAELERMGIDSKDVKMETETEKLHLKSVDELLGLAGASGKNWTLSAFTSGTTGIPQKVTHTFETLAKGVRTGERFRGNAWGFAYNPTHFAGLQVFFQAFMNINPMVFLFNADRKGMDLLLARYGITNISATPSFYRTMIYSIKDTVESVRNITLGGEKYDPALEKILKEKFPNARVRNIYASTEAGSLFSSDGDSFRVHSHLKGKVKFAKNGELLIHKDLLGASDGFKMEGDWYRTGDIVESLEGDTFRFVSRASEMINVGGYNVNPHDVEEEIKAVDGVVDALVKPRKTRITGNILTAEVALGEGVESQDFEKVITDALSGKLQAWKIPRIIRFVKEVEKTRTGKKVRL